MNAFPLVIALCIYAEVNELGSEDWGRRELASKNLEAAFPLSVGAIHAAADHKDPEIASRCRNLAFRWDGTVTEFRTWKWRRALERARILRCRFWNFVPYIDMLPDDMSNKMDIIYQHRELARINDVKADVPANERWANDRAATLSYVADLILDGATDAQIIALFELMVVRERHFLGMYPEILDICRCEQIPAPGGK